MTAEAAEQARTRLAVLQAVLAAMEHPELIAQLASRSQGAEQFHQLLMDELSIGDAGARAVTDMQVRRFFLGEQARVRQDIAAVERDLGESRE